MDLEKNRKKIPLIIIVILAIGAAILLVTQMEIDTEPEPEPKTYHELEVQIEDQTRGTVEITPEKEEYEKGEEVTLTATPDQGWEFARWSGDHQGENPEITIKIDENKQINAHFKEEDEEIERAKFKPEIISPREIDPMPLEREVQVLYSVTNEGETTDTQTVELRVNGETIDSREHTLQPGETQQNTFTWTPQQEEEKTITLETLNIIESQQITIKEYPDPETPGEVVEAYVWFLDHALLEEMEKLSTGERKQYFEQLTEEDREGIKYSSRNSNNTVEVIEEKIDEDTATVEAEVTWEASREHEDYEETSNRTYHLQQEQQQWKIAEIE